MWQYRGAPYKAKILEVHGMQTLYSNIVLNIISFNMLDKKPMPSDKKKSPYKRKYLEDSSDKSDDSDNLPPPKKPLHQKKGSCSTSSPPVVLSDGERSPGKSKSVTDRLSSQINIEVIHHTWPRK